MSIAARWNLVPVLGNFDAIWTVKNLSGYDWRTDLVDYQFISGTKMYKQAGYDFTQTIKNGESGVTQFQASNQ